MKQKRTTKWVKQGDKYVEVPLVDLQSDDKAEIKTKEKKEVVKKITPTVKKITEKAKSSSGLYVILCEESKSVYVGYSVNPSVMLRVIRLGLRSDASSEVCLRLRGDFAKGYEFAYSVRDTGDYDTLGLMLVQQNVISEYLKLGYRLYNTCVS